MLNVKAANLMFAFYRLFAKARLLPIAIYCFLTTSLGFLKHEFYLQSVPIITTNSALTQTFQGLHRTPLLGSFWIDTIEALSIHTIVALYLQHVPLALRSAHVLLFVLSLTCLCKAIHMHSKCNRSWSDT